MGMFWLWLKAVGKHWKREVLGGALIGLLALFSELSGITVVPRIYEACSAIVLFYAMFLAWRDQAEALENERARKEKEPTPEGKALMNFLDPTLRAQNRLAAALERQVEHEDRARVSKILHPPGPMIGLQVACEPSQARLFVKNDGTTAAFYGVFTVTGLTTAKPGETFYCKWQHTYSKRIKIPKGQGFWILLAILNTDSLGSSRWEISAIKESEDGKDLTVLLPAIYSSSTISTPIAVAPDITIEGSIVADPDAANGVQSFRVVLHAFGTEIPQD